ncbi:MAG: oxidoreductase [Alteromonadaceae bacterium]|nr:oxidoreductase [Alteromonadaceae bacterium]MBH86729.1 oxidoreductase [Alteromonadaceae bacterium]|tara:strand:- start:5472 stop:6575 length:1104 start_codon:yes stop_codon:yes gene_type:complete
MLSTIEKSSPLRWLGKQLFNRNDPAGFFDPLLTMINPMWAQGFVAARVESVIDETADTRTFLLQPSSRWHGFRAGQHINIIVDSGGVRHHRTFTVSSTPAQWRTDGTITLTIKRAPGGRITNWMHDHLQAGATIGISEAFGDFDLPAGPSPLLYIAGGSGITPVLSHLATLADSPYAAPVSLLYYVRTEADVIGAEILNSLAANWPALTVSIFHTEVGDDSQHINPSHFKNIPELSERQVYLCGPKGLMDRVDELLAPFGLRDDQINKTFFSAPTSVPLDTPLGGAITFTRSSVNVESDGDAPLLEIAEAADLTPAYGCRMGICHQCSCKKTEGTVINRLTGKASGPGEETIQLCISVPQGPVSIDI